MTIHPDLTLVTYTCNDRDLALELIKSAPGWSLRPARLLVVDDGSETPFALPADHSFGSAEILRHARNKGPAMAKRTGLNAAQTSLILSMDCDIRLHPNWLKEALKLLGPEPDAGSSSERAIGLVGADIQWASGRTVTSRYLHHFWKPGQESDSPRFVRAGVWLLRRSIWLSVDGFGDFSGRTHEDFVFCNRLLGAGYGLRLCKTHPANQVRQVHRLDMARKEFSYLGPGLRAAIMKSGPVMAVEPLVATLAANIEQSLKLEEHGFVYLELLRFTGLAGKALDGGKAGEQAGEYVPTALKAFHEDLLQAMADLLAPHKALNALFRRDLLALGLVLPKPGIKALRDEFWKQVMALLSPLSRQGVFSRIEVQDLPAFLEEDELFQKG